MVTATRPPSAPEIEHLGDFVEDVQLSVLLERKLALDEAVRERNRLTRQLRSRLQAEGLEADHKYRIGNRTIVA